MDARVTASAAADAAKEPGVVDAGVFVGGQRVASTSIDEAGSWSKKPGHVVWIGLFEPSYDLLRRVQAQFGLHDLAIEDAENAHQHPKLEQYGEALFVVARTAQIVGGRVAFGETPLFVGRGYGVFGRPGPSTSYTTLAHTCEARPTALSPPA